jgi:signal-transduction protein with cAMP-binding, CBS, and nucleotidyltransferase domain
MSMAMVREAMSQVGVTVGSAHTMREAARRMTEGGTGAAIVLDHDLPAPGIVTERDVLRCVGTGGDLDRSASVPISPRISYTRLPSGPSSAPPRR